MTNATEPVLVAKDLHAGYLPGVNILNGVNIVAHPGELIGIIGPNGAGKSTFLKAVFGQVSIRGGSVTLKGTDITGWKPNKLVSTGVGFVPQTNNVFPSLTIEENLQMGIYQKPRKFREQLDKIFEIFPVLADRRDQRAGSLSGGERQSVAMARALMMDPSVLLLDEPSAGLSPVRQDETFIRTRRINKAGVSVIMVEQNARRCLQICDRAYVLDQGRDAYTGTGRELANDPKVIQLYLGTLAADVDADKSAPASAGAPVPPATEEPAPAGTVTPDEQVPTSVTAGSSAAEDLPPGAEPMSDPGVEPDAGKA
ncbi:branched-chain amino acid transport system ATP-binding protein [Microbacterium sp. SORGH_AS428]|nr:branched-chain amino acid transport system ATP-binding protein [Microbacterium sp. SORGH_AS_0428]